MTCLVTLKIKEVASEGFALLGPEVDRILARVLILSVCLSVTDLLPTADRFTDAGVSAFDQLLFDVLRDQVVVGAR